MNPFASVTQSTLTNFEEHLSNTKYSAVVYGFRSFKEAIELNNSCRNFNIPFYLLNSSGLFGFFFIDVGKDLTFMYHKKSTEMDETHTITNSKTFE